MPQGVEHKFVNLWLIMQKMVPKPLMPQGVEHSDFVAYKIEGIAVPKPLMPQGVEHPDACRLLAGWGAEFPNL